MTTEKKIWIKALELRDGSSLLSYFALRRAEVQKERCIILEEIMDPMQAPTKVRRALSQPDSFEKTSLAQLKASMLDLFPEAEVLKKKWAWVLRNSIFNEAFESAAKYDRDSGVAQHMTSAWLLTSYVENG